MRVKVHSAGIQDRDGGRLVLEPLREARFREQFPRLSHIWLDGGYRGEFEGWVEKTLGWSVEVVKRNDEAPIPKPQPKGVWMLGEMEIDWSVIEPPPEIMAQLQSEMGQSKGGGFRLLPRRWVVERTFGWLGWYRRLSRDYEYLPQSSEAVIYASMSRLMVRRLRKLAVYEQPSTKQL